MKKIFGLFIILSLLIAPVSSAYASNVIYDGVSKEFIYESESESSPSDLFENFKSIMPGDTLTQKITVRNDADNEVKVKIYMRSLGANEEGNEFLSKLGLKVGKSEENEMAYMFDAAANETEGLSDWVLLGTLYSGGKVNLDVILSVPTSLGNEFQDNSGEIVWEFKVEEFPIEPDDPTPPPTGDDSFYKIYIALMLGSFIVFILILLYRRKDKENA